jgi:ABC-2 type transport system permease protein
MSLTFVASLAAASALCLAYTVWLIGAADVISFLGLNLLLALFLVFCLAVTVLFSSVFNSSLAAGGVSLGMLVGQGVLSVLPWVGDYMPGRLLGWGNALFTGGRSYWWSVGVTVVLIGLCLYLAQRSLKNKEMQ